MSFAAHVRVALEVVSLLWAARRRSVLHEVAVAAYILWLIVDELLHPGRKWPS